MRIVIIRMLVRWDIDSGMVLLSAGRTNREMDVCDCRVALASENHTREKENACKS